MNAVRGLWRGRLDLDALMSNGEGSSTQWKSATQTQRLVVRQMADVLAKEPYSEDPVVGQRAYISAPENPVRCANE